MCFITQRQRTCPINYIIWYILKVTWGEPMTQHLDIIYLAIIFIGVSMMKMKMLTSTEKMGRFFFKQTST